MFKFPKPWNRKGRGWYVTLDGRQISLGENRKAAFEEYRRLLKQPEFLILNKPLSALDQQSQKQIAVNVLDWARSAAPRPAIIWVLASPDLARLFDRTVD